MLTASALLPAPVEGERQRAVRRIRRYYRLQRRAFLRYCQRTLLPDGGVGGQGRPGGQRPCLVPGRAVLRVTYNENGLLEPLYPGPAGTVPARAHFLLTRRGHLGSDHRVSAPGRIFSPAAAGKRRLAAAEAEIRRREAPEGSPPLE